MTETKAKTATIANWGDITFAFKAHLMGLLPLYAVSHSGDKNETIQYIEKFLETKQPNRAWKKDRLGNIIVYPVGREIDSTETVGRAMVAHTDTVPGHGRSREVIKYNPVFDVIYNQDKTRPMGGDDKVGVAACLAVMPYRPDWAFYLVADEEVGCVGSRQVDIPDTLIACQLDRRGCNEITETISGTLCYTKKTKAAVNEIIKQFPNLKWAMGAMTDVGTLVSRGKVRCGSNFACGYYNPHSSEEFIRYGEAENSLGYAVTILDNINDDDLEMAKNESAYSSFGRGYYDGLDDGLDEAWSTYYKTQRAASTSLPNFPNYPKVNTGLYVIESNQATILSKIMSLYGETPEGLVAPTNDEDIEFLGDLYYLLTTKTDTEEDTKKKEEPTSVISSRPSWMENPPKHLLNAAETGWIPANLINASIQRGVRWYLVRKVKVEPYITELRKLECEIPGCKSAIDFTPLKPDTWCTLPEASATRVESGDIIVALAQDNIDCILCPGCATDPNLEVDILGLSNNNTKILNKLDCVSATKLMEKLRGKRIVSID